MTLSKKNKIRKHAAGQTHPFIGRSVSLRIPPTEEDYIVTTLADAVNMRSKAVIEVLCTQYGKSVDEANLIVNNVNKHAILLAGILNDLNKTAPLDESAFMPKP